MLLFFSLSLFLFLTDCKTKNLLNHFGLCFAWKNCWPGKKFLLLIQWNIFYISLLLCTVVLHYLVTILGSKLLWKLSHHIVWMPVIVLSLVYIPLYFRGEELLLKHVWLYKVCCGNYRNHRVFFCLFHFSSWIALLVCLIWQVLMTKMWCWKAWIIAQMILFFWKRNMPETSCLLWQSY